jgi:prophage regulatory protein
MQPNNLSFRRCPAARAVFGIGNATFYEWISKGLMTPGVALGARTVGWPEHELLAIAAARIAGKSDDEIRALTRQLVADRAKYGQIGSAV